MFDHIHPDNYDSQLLQKQHDMTELFSDFNMPCAEIFTSDKLNYRLRAEFRVWHQENDLYYIMFNSDTKEKFRVDDFPVASKLINQAMKSLLIAIKDKPALRYKLFQVDFLSTLSGELLISLLYHKPLEQNWQEAALALKQQLSYIAPVDIIGRAKKQKIIVEKDYLMESLQVGLKRYVYQQVENSFTQPNGGVNQKMLFWAQQVTAQSDGDLIELYCGNGNFSIALAENFNRVLGTEISKSSVRSAQVNIKANNIENINIVRMSSEEFSQAMNNERKFRRLEGFDLTAYNYDTVLVDPPRAGLDNDSIELVSRFKKIVYISCNPTTLKDNLTLLTKTHHINKFALFDQFPYTDHIETGVVLTRKVS
ncbi:MAG: tRNA (uridine(54)-C5)-methyltransferase TrmA [Litorilituus sp.]|jgi:tRNA (uracil-5-)-methyltransferase|nr:tRNA (uridine(54)-C5)-methyltransferase TrmA [Litorilituus sp.]